MDISSEEEREIGERMEVNDQEITEDNVMKTLNLVSSLR